MRLNKSLILMGAVRLVSLAGGMAATPALADNPYYENHREREIHREQEARRAYEARWEHRW